MSVLPTIQRMMPRHFKIIELALAGHSPAAIARTLALTAQSVNLVLKQPLVQAELVRRRRESSEDDILQMDADATRGKALSILEQATIPAAQKFVDLLDSPDDAIKLRAAEKILDRALGPTGPGGKAGLVVNISAEHVQLLNLALQESFNGSVSSADCTVSTNPQVRSGAQYVSDREGNCDLASAQAAIDQPSHVHEGSSGGTEPA